MALVPLTEDEEAEEEDEMDRGYDAVSERIKPKSWVWPTEADADQADLNGPSDAEGPTLDQ